MKDQDIEGMNATEYKTYHESLMQNNHGTSALHVFCCILFTVQCSIYSSVKIKDIQYQQIYEYIVIVLPLVMAHTVLSDYLYLLNFIIFAMLLREITTHYYLKYIKNVKREKSNHNKRIQTISVMRGLTYLITTLCILAVDFRNFPRGLAKTERYGYSLMDTGVGLFVLMSGIVHKDLLKNNWRNVFLGNMKFIVILASLGIVRYASVKQLDYQEHVSEYGVHWNFFFTLAVCKFLSTFILYFSSKSYSSTNTIVQSFMLLIIHEFILCCGVQQWVFGNTPRDSIFSANREGLSSCLGYVAMYLFASHLKDELMNKRVVKNMYYNGTRIDITLLKLILSSFILWILTFSLDYLKTASRTLANAAYCIFIESILTTVVAILYFFEKYFYNEKGNFKMPKIIENVNSNGLLYFLIANLITGAINLSIRTLLVSSFMTFVVLNVYMIVTLALPTYVKKAAGILFY